MSALQTAECLSVPCHHFAGCLGEGQMVQPWPNGRSLSEAEAEALDAIAEWVMGLP
jgi:hypothetical protein